MTSKPKVLHVSKCYPPYVGGVETALRNLAESLADRCEQEVLVSQPLGLARHEIVNGVSVHRTASLGIGWSMPISLSYPFAFRSRVARFDLVHLHHPYPLGGLSSLAFGSGVETVLTWYSGILRQKRMARLYRPFLERLLDRVQAIIVIFPGAEQSSGILKTFAHKCRVIPLGIDVGRYAMDDLLKSEVEGLRNRYAGNLILSVGRLVYYKGLQHLISGMPDISGHLLIAGEGPLRRQLENLSAEKGVSDRVHFLGHLDDWRLKAAFHACDVFVLPSTHSTEAFGIVQLEAMACGKPVVNTNLPTGVPYVSRDGETGITVEAGNSQALAGAVERLLRDHELRRTLGGNGRRRVLAEFTLQSMAERTLKLYREVLAI